MDVSRSRSAGVFKPQTAINDDVSLHAKEPLIALLGLVHVLNSLSLRKSAMVSKYRASRRSSHNNARLRCASRFISAGWIGPA